MNRARAEEQTRAGERYAAEHEWWTWEPFEHLDVGGFLNCEGAEYFAVLNLDGQWEAWLDGSWWIHPEGDSEAFVYFDSPEAAICALDDAT